MLKCKEPDAHYIDSQSYSRPDEDNQMSKSMVFNDEADYSTFGLHRDASMLMPSLEQNSVLDARDMERINELKEKRRQS